MGIHVNRSVSWRAGEGTPIKYTFSIDANLELEDFIGMSAVINLNGTVTITNNPTNSRNSWAASDFAVLTPGNINVDTHPFVYGVSYYEHYIPFLPDPQNSDQDGIIIQFRGDTWISDPNNNNNRVSLYVVYDGLVADQIDQSTTISYPVNFSYEVPVIPGTDFPVLAWITSGAASSTDYGWDDKQVWASWFDFDYRPGATLDTNTSVWKSHNRINGACHVLSDASNLTWQECRTLGGDASGQGNPPLILHAANANSWYNQKKLGKMS